MATENLNQFESNCEGFQRKPNKFTHHISKKTPFYCKGMQQSTPPEGNLNEGDKVILYADNGAQVWVITETAMLVAISSADITSKT